MSTFQRPYAGICTGVVMHHLCICIFVFMKSIGNKGNEVSALEVSEHGALDQERGNEESVTHGVCMGGIGH